jgi:PAS domain S-box-containing protein
VIVDEAHKLNQDTERLRLFEAARRYKDFTELSRDWYWEMDDQLQFSYFSKEFEEATGLPLAGILDKTRWEGLGAEEYGEVDWQGHKQTLMCGEERRAQSSRC